MEARSQHHALRQLMQAVEATMQKQRRAALIREYKQVMLLCSREGKQKSVQEDAEGQERTKHPFQFLMHHFQGVPSSEPRVLF